MMVAGGMMLAARSFKARSSSRLWPHISASNAQQQPKNQLPFFWARLRIETETKKLPRVTFRFIFLNIQFFISFRVLRNKDIKSSSRKFMMESKRPHSGWINLRVGAKKKTQLFQTFAAGDQLKPTAAKTWWNFLLPYLLMPQAALHWLFF